MRFYCGQGHASSFRILSVPYVRKTGRIFPRLTLSRSWLFVVLFVCLFDCSFVCLFPCLFDFSPLISSRGSFVGLVFGFNCRFLLVLYRVARTRSTAFQRQSYRTTFCSSAPAAITRATTHLVDIVVSHKMAPDLFVLPKYSAFSGWDHLGWLPTCLPSNGLTHVLLPDSCCTWECRCRL